MNLYQLCKNREKTDPMYRRLVMYFNARGKRKRKFPKLHDNSGWEPSKPEIPRGAG